MTAPMGMGAFTRALDDFDWSHHMSDSFEVWRRGDARMFELSAIAKASGPEFVALFNSYKNTLYYTYPTSPQRPCSKCGVYHQEHEYTKGEKWCRSCRKEVNDRNNARNNHVRRWARLLSGLTTKDLYDLPKPERAKWLNLARDIVAAGADYAVAASQEAKRTDGVIYVIDHPRLKGVKIGRAFDADSRLNNYQTGCPHREYRLFYVSSYVEDVAGAEQYVHAQLADERLRGEWFELTPIEAQRRVKAALAAFTATS